MKKSKIIHLMNEKEENCRWRLVIGISAKQCVWSGNFNFGESKKNIEEAMRENPYDTVDEIESYRQWRRRNDRKWAKNVFPQQWLQQFEIHHFWGVGEERCFFLTPEEHRKRDVQIRLLNIMAESCLANSSRRICSTKLIRIRHRDKRYKHFLRIKERYHRHKLLSSFEDYYEDKKPDIFPYIEEESFSESDKAKRKAKTKYKQALILRSLIQDEQKGREQI